MEIPGSNAGKKLISFVLFKILGDCSIRVFQPCNFSPGLFSPCNSVAVNMIVSNHKRFEL